MSFWPYSFDLINETVREKLSDALICKFTHQIEQLQEEIKSQFSDVSEHIAKDRWLDPFLEKKEDVKYLKLEDELMDFKSNSPLKRLYVKHGDMQFWLVKGPGIIPRLALHTSTRLILLFLTTYLSETAVSALVTTKPKAHIKLANMHITFIWMLGKSHHQAHIKCQAVCIYENEEV